jgi:hypothetical protein
MISRVGRPRRWNVSTVDEGYKNVRQSQVILDAGKVANGTKHFQLRKIATGRQQGAFQRGAFQDNAFAVPYLWIEKDRGRQRAEDFIQELVDVWTQFFDQHALA